MPSAKDSSSPRAASSRKKEPGGEQLPQMSSGIQTLINKLAIHQDADLRSRIESNQRLAQAVDEYYDYKLFDGKGKQAMKRCHEYMDIQNGISECLYELTNELMCRVRVRNDIALLTRMQTEDPNARIFAGTKSETHESERDGKAMPHDHISDRNAVLRNIMSSFLEKTKLVKPEAQAQSEAAPDEENQPTQGNETKEGSQLSSRRVTKL